MAKCSQLTALPFKGLNGIQTLYCTVAVRPVCVCPAMRVAFAMCDRDADGLISIQEVHDTMTSLGHRVSHKQVKQIVRRVDTDRKFSTFTFGFGFCVYRVLCC